MGTAYVIVAIFLAAVLTFSAVATYRRLPVVATNLTAAGVKPEQFPFLAAVKAAGAIGLVIGIWVPLLGVAAAAGLVLYFLGAVGAHLRVKHYELVPPAALLLISVAALVLRAGSLQVGA